MSIWQLKPGNFHQCVRRFISLTISINPVPETVKPFTVNQHGYSLNAAVACTADRRDRLERLCRYVARPAIALERLSLNRRGEVLFALKAPSGRHHTPEVHAGRLHGAARCAEPIPNSAKRNKAWAIELLALRCMRRSFKVIVLFVISASRRALYIDNQKRNLFASIKTDYSRRSSGHPK